MSARRSGRSCSYPAESGWRRWSARSKGSGRSVARREQGNETSGEMASDADVDETGLLAEVRFRHRMDLSRYLVPRVQQVLGLAGCAVDGLDGIAVSAGPGSFTGLRIGVTVAKALAYGRGLPIAGVSTLRTL